MQAKFRTFILSTIVCVVWRFLFEKHSEDKTRKWHFKLKKVIWRISCWMCSLVPMNLRKKSTVISSCLLGPVVNITNGLYHLSLCQFYRTETLLSPVVDKNLRLGAGQDVWPQNPSNKMNARCRAAQCSLSFWSDDSWHFRTRLLCMWWEQEKAAKLHFKVRSWYF